MIGYVAVGFALQFGGIGLTQDQPGFAGLIWEWSALGPTWGPGWGMTGLVGWGLTGPAATSAAYALALANLPWVITAALIPLIGLRGRIPGWAAIVLGLLIGGLIYPLAGNWIWGGGWLANLGLNLGLGHGYVDVAGAGLVHLLGAAAALAGILVFLPRRPRSAAPGEAPLPANPLAAAGVAGRRGVVDRQLRLDGRQSPPAPGYAGPVSAGVERHAGRGCGRARRARLHLAGGR